MKASIAFGDNVRILASPETEGRGLAGAVGQVLGHTTPSVTGVTVLGELDGDLAINVQFDDGTSEWFAPQLLEFVDHAPGTTMALGVGADRRSWTRNDDGEWTEDAPTKQERPWWRFW